MEPVRFETPPTCTQREVCDCIVYPPNLSISVNALIAGAENPNPLKGNPIALRIFEKLAVRAELIACPEAGSQF